ncbi:MAG: hypothetical protein AB1505_25890 [Candidatus Latescibacterota bacterium]
MDSDGRNVVRLTHNEVCDVDPTWTPDGRILVSRPEVAVRERARAAARHLRESPGVHLSYVAVRLSRSGR